MYLEKLEIKNFRSISYLQLYFQRGLNIIIGENNSGKSAIVDALRITLGYAKQWRDIGVRNDEDFHVDVSEIKDLLDPVEFHLRFKIESPQDAHTFHGMLVQDPDDPQLQWLEMHFRYFLEENALGTKTLKYRTWAGVHEENQIKGDEAQQIYFSYLAPLRNAEQELRPYAKENKVISLFKEMSKYTITVAGVEQSKDLNVQAKKELAAKLKSVIDDADWTGLIKSGEGLVNEHLEKADITKKNSRIHLRLLEYEYNNIIKGLLLRRPAYSADLLAGDDTKQKFFDINQNGLGENNLIYASAVLGDLKNRRILKKEQYYALLIEEPEAHLHPQKQNTFFNYLNNLQDFEVQVFITSHSPTLTAKSDLDSIIILQKQLNQISSFTFNKSPLTKENKSYLRKFVDVTKSQLFFSNGTILVEGISEALLLPVFAKMVGEKYDLDKNGIELVNINGVAFESFARLYNSTQAGQRLPSRCAIITDNDKGIITSTLFIDQSAGIDKNLSKEIFTYLLNKNFINSDNRVVNYSGDSDLLLPANVQAHEAHIKTRLSANVSKISSRAANAMTYSSGNLKSYLAEYTFEFELLTASDFNFKVVRGIYSAMHNRTEFLSTGTLQEKAMDLLERLNKNKDKSQLAENLSYFLETRPKSRGKFNVPTYLSNAIKWVVDGE